MALSRRQRLLYANNVRSGYFPIPGLGNLNDGLYIDFTKGSLVPERGPTFSQVRAGASTTTDHESLIRNILSGEARFAKLRRVENLFATTTEDFSNVAWTKSATGVAIAPTATGNFGTDPLGGSTASRVQFSLNGGTATGDISLLRQGIAYSAARYSVSIYVKSNTAATYVMQIIGADGNGANITVTPTWQRFAISATATGTTNVGLRLRGGLAPANSDAADVLVWGGQTELTQGQAISAPSEYVSKGVLSTPFHGAGVDGVRYFNTANGNTVASNVVTEAAGAALDTTAAGLWVHGAATNLVLQSEDFSTTWAAAGSPTRSAAAANVGSVVLDLIGDDSALALEGYTQTVTFTGNAVKAVSLFVKEGTSASTAVRILDTSAVAERLLAFITWSGGVPSVAMTTGTLEGTDELAGGVYRIRVLTTSITAANTNSLRIYPATTNVTTDVDSTGNVYVGGVMAENATSVSPYVKTTTGTVTVPADVVTASGAGVINQTEGGLWVEAIVPALATASAIFELDNGTTNERARLDFSGASTRMVVTDGGVEQAVISASTPAAGTTFKAAGRYRLNDTNGALNGTAGTADTTCTMPTTTTLSVGARTSGTAAHLGGVIKKLALSRTGPSDANLAVSTTP